MLNAIIDFSLRNRLLVLLVALAAAAAGIVSLRQLDIDAFPDTTPVQVQINTVVPSLGPAEVEQQVTTPVEQALSGLPRVENIRSISKFGLSQVVVLFAEGTDIYFARQLINERLSAVELPVGVERPKMGPVATGLGEVFHYVVATKGDDKTDARTVHDWVVKPKLRAVPGTAEINSWGGFAKQFQIRVDPNRLIRYGLTFDDVARAVEDSNRSVGGGTTQRGDEMLLVQGLGRTATTEQIADIIIHSHDGVPVKLREVATVSVGHEVRRGAVTANGKGEVVLGLGFLTMGENSHRVTANLKQELTGITANMPSTTTVTPVYDRTELIDHVINTVQQNLFEAGLLVIAILFAFLGNFRAAAIVALAIPLSMLFAFSGMLRFGIAASLLSLGALDFGMIVDSSVVMVENCVRHLAHAAPEKSRREIIRDAAVEVRGPTLFGELIIAIVYLPILTLEGIEGKLFRPMALTVIFALIGSMILSMTVMPVLASLLLPQRIVETEPLMIRIAKAIYAPILRFAMHQKVGVLLIAGMLLVFAFGFIAPSLGTEFVPRLSEGAITINVIRLAGTDLSESVRGNTRIEIAILAAFPDEVEHVWSRVGTPEVATDPMGVELSDVFITLKPRSRWKRAATQAELTVLIEQELRDLPGQKLSFSQPIEMRINEMVSGVRSDVGVKIFGDDFDTLTRNAHEVEGILKSIPGSADINVEQLTGQPVLQVKLRPDELARYGVSAKMVLDLVESIGTKHAGEVYDGPYRFPLTIRLTDSVRANPQAISSLMIPTATGSRVPLSRLASLEIIEGPSTITREWGQRRITVTCNVRGRDLGSFVVEAQQRVAAEVVMPSPRYHVEWGGQYEHLIRASNRLMIVVPLALALIFGLLYATYHNVVDALRVFTGVPFAWVGGLIALWLRDMPFSISAAVGFIALSGLAVLDDMILVSTIRQLRSRGRTLDQAVEEAAMTRLRPVLMTSLVASLGFVPMAFSTGMGAEVQRPLATVVIGGVLSAMVMSLLVLRVLYVVTQWRPFQSKAVASEPAAVSV